MSETLVIHAEMAELGRVGEWAEAFAKRVDLPQKTLFALQLCFEEAVSNIINYGFADLEDRAGLNKDICLTLNREIDAITATIEDHAIAFDPLEMAAPVAATTISDAPVGGLGIHLIKQFAQHLAYERHDSMNRLTLRFDLTKADD
jgi:anti-sigma regulatory factor (Ser/Thr protein kinase)